MSDLDEGTGQPRVCLELQLSACLLEDRLRTALGRFQSAPESHCDPRHDNSRDCCSETNANQAKLTATVSLCAISIDREQPL
jgi:hypothetical protein